jgi:tetratricopeptide (TPR) repeat protein
MKFRKGDVVINKKCPWHVVALTEEDTYVKKRKGFPRYSSERDDPYRSAPSYSESIHTFLEKIDKSHHYSRYEVYEIQVAFSLVDSGKHDEFEARKEQTEPHPLTKPSWRFVQEKIEYHRWEAVISIVRQRMIVVSVDHPMMRYATEVVPKLKEPELLVLTRQLPGYKKRTSALAVMKYLQDHLQQQMYAVIDPNVCIGNYQHSCAPNCVFELSATNPENTLELSLVALYDVSDESEITICQIEEHDSVELRENALQRRTGHSCGCLRCRYEACNWISHPPQTNLREAQQLGHFYFSAGNLELAKKMYEMTLEQVPNDPDLWHALGAVYLAERKFVQAQRIWKKAAENYPKECGNHKEIRLQLDKIASYEYFSRSEVPATETSHSWHAVVNQAFVTKEVISRETCQQVIRWAESGEWTTQRHYAVPTHDVPVHTVPKLLDWSKRLFKTSIQPILVSQFGLSPHFYIHDAFCVKYEGGSFSNHLPIHVDESTHSFVLALNDDYEGGGTYFYDEDTTVHLKTGDLLSFKGDSVYHGGEVLTQGTRYIIAAFLYHDDGNNESAKSDENSCRKRQAGDLQSEFQKTKEQKTSFCFGFKG